MFYYVTLPVENYGGAAWKIEPNKKIGSALWQCIWKRYSFITSVNCNKVQCFEKIKGYLRNRSSNTFLNYRLSVNHNVLIQNVSHSKTLEISRAISNIVITFQTIEKRLSGRRDGQNNAMRLTEKDLRIEYRDYHD